MVRIHLAVFIVFVGSQGNSIAQSAPVKLQFAWKAGQTLVFNIEQNTVITETVNDESSSRLITNVTQTQLALTRQWTVTAVDATDTATMDMTISAFKQDTTRTYPGQNGAPTSSKDSLDSANPADKAKLPFLGKAAVTVKVDVTGQVLEAKSITGGSSVARLKADLPFRVVLPATGVAVGAKWDQPFNMKIDPPFGTGESLEFVRRVTLNDLTGAKATLAMTTEIKAAPATTAEWLPLIPMLWEGEVAMDTATGAYLGAKLTVKKVLPNHQGEGTKFVYSSVYKETPAK